MTRGAPLRVAVALQPGRQPRWIAELLGDLAQSQDAALTCVVSLDVPAGRPRNGEAWPAHWLYGLYRGIDRRVFPVRPDPFEPVDVGSLLRGLPTLSLDAGAVHDRREVCAAALAAVAAQRVDVVLWLSPTAPVALPSEVAAHGVWWYAHGGADLEPGAPAGVWEVLEDSPVTPVTLYATSADGTARAVGRSHMRTQRISVNRNRARCYQKSIALVIRALRALRERGAVADAAATPAPSARPPDDSVTRRGVPTNGETFVRLARIGAKYVGRRLTRGASPGDWFVAYGFGSDGARSHADPSHFTGFTQLRAPAGRFWADPFPAVVDGRYYIFVEEYVYSTEKGHIAVLDVTPDVAEPRAVPVLDRDYHLSYPFIFRWQGEHYMVPESVHNQTVEMYRATHFPHAWVPHATLLENVRAVDATLAEVNGRWWMFTAIGQERADGWSDWNEELHLYHAPSPFGPWTPHRRNPVKSDVRGSRPAGRLFERAGELYRPAQDCAERYGRAILINRVVTLDTEDFREMPVSRISPTWAPKLVGTHTLNHAGGLTVIDGRVGRPWLPLPGLIRASASDRRRLPSPGR